MSNLIAPPSFSEYFTVGEAAKVLGVSPATLRNWDRSGKLKPRRHPQNGYRIYLHQDLEALLQSADKSLAPDEPTVPEINWSNMAEKEHFVQFYESDDYLMDSVFGFVVAAITEGNSSVVIATAEHRQTLELKLEAANVDVPAALDSGTLILLDAQETLSRFMVNAGPDAKLFEQTVGAVIKQLAARGKRIHAFGEMVALLWADGNREAAIRLEELWNGLSKEHRFALFCAYPIHGFGDESQLESFDSVCTCHTRVIPAESYSGLADPNERLLEISSLQQRALSLQAEIAHRHEVEKVLTDRERELSDFFENATEGIHKVGPDGQILWANKAEYSLLGYTAQEYIGQPITHFHADAEVIADMLDRLKRGENLDNYPARLRCKNGEIKQVLINSNACFDDGKFAYTRCFTRDITARWQAEQALRDADRRKDEFLAMLAHELRNPLAPIRSALDMMRLMGGDGENVEVREIMERQVGQLHRLVDDLLDVSRITRDKIELRKERVSLDSLVQTAVETSRPGIAAAGHKLQVTLPREPVWLLADPCRMAQVLYNLLNNSAKYTERGGCIELTAERQEGELVISVKDNGIGIACDALAHVFDMFRQVEGSRNRAQGGLGIGLALVRRLVEMHGGTVNALSEGRGKGSEFVVRLPLADSDGGRAAASAASGKPAVETSATEKMNLEKSVSLKRRILIVDDNRDTSDTLGMLLRVRGNDVRTAYSGADAIAAAADFQPHVILMDVGMPLMDGYEATRRIRELPGCENVYVVALSGFSEDDHVARSVAAGCSAHLVKPVDFMALDRLLPALN